MLRKRLLVGNWSLQFPCCIFFCLFSYVFVFINKIGWELKRRDQIHFSFLWLKTVLYTGNTVTGLLTSPEGWIKNPQLLDSQLQICRFQTQCPAGSYTNRLCTSSHDPHVSSHCKLWRIQTLQDVSFCQLIDLNYSPNVSNCWRVSASVCHWERSLFSNSRNLTLNRSSCHSCLWHFSLHFVLTCTAVCFKVISQRTGLNAWREARQTDIWAFTSVPWMSRPFNAGSSWIVFQCSTAGLGHGKHLGKPPSPLYWKHKNSMTNHDCKEQWS